MTSAAFRPHCPGGKLRRNRSQRRLRDQLDIDSMDFLNFVVALHKELGVDIPEKDYKRFATIDDFVDYLQTKLAARSQ